MQGVVAQNRSSFIQTAKCLCREILDDKKFYPTFKLTQFECNIFRFIKNVETNVVVLEDVLPLFAKERLEEGQSTQDGVSFSIYLKH